MELPVYALDIETDTSISPTSGLDPNQGGITSIALVTPMGDFVLDRSMQSGEAGLLREIERLLKDELDPGVIASWNGSVFDFPFLDARSRRLGVSLSLALKHDPSIPVKYEPTPGYLGGYRVKWGQHLHSDVQFAYQSYALEKNVKWSLKPVGRAMGYDPIEVDRERMHLLTLEEEREYVLSDTRVTRSLLLDAWAAKNPLLVIDQI